jgi:hypothetical protein
VINAAVLCVLISSAGNPACIAPASSAEVQRVSAVGEALQTKGLGQTKRPLFAANDRIKIIAPSTSLKLAEENELSLSIHASSLVKVETDQAQYLPEDLQTRRLPPSRPEGGYTVLPILYHSDGSPYVKVIPRRLGKVVLELRAFFEDGGSTKTDVTLDVVPPSRSLLGS